MADLDIPAPKPKAKPAGARRQKHAERMKRRQKIKARQVAQGVTSSQTASETTIDSAEASQEVPVTTPPKTMNGSTPAVTAPAPAQVVESAEKTPKEPENVWGTKKQSPPAQTGQVQRSSGVRPGVRPSGVRPLGARFSGPRPPPNVRPTRNIPPSATNGHAALTIPTRPRPSQPQSSQPDRRELFKGKVVARQEQPPTQRLNRRVNVRDRLKNKHLIASMPDDYVAHDYSAQRRAGGGSPQRETREPATVRPRGPPTSARPSGPRPSGPRPESARRLARDNTRGAKNGRTLQNGSSPSSTPSRQSAPSREERVLSRDKPTRQSPQRPQREQRQPQRQPQRQQRVNGSSTPSSRSTTKSSSKSSSLSRTPSSSATTSSTSSPVRRPKKNLRRHGMTKVKNAKGKRIIKKQTAVWLNGISDPEQQSCESTLDPEAPLFETRAILTENGGFLTDEYYRQSITVPMTQQPVQAISVAQQPVTPTEPDFSQAANNFPAAYPNQIHDMFGATDYYGYSAYQMYPTTDGFMSGHPPPHATHVPSQFGGFGNFTPNEFSEPYPQFHSTNHPGAGYYASAPGYASQPATGAYSGAGSQVRLNGMTSGATSGSASVSVTAAQDLTQMIPPTHFPSNGHVNGNVAVLNGAVTQGPVSAELTGVSSSTISEQSGHLNGNDPAAESFYEASNFYQQRNVI